MSTLYRTTPSEVRGSTKEMLKAARAGVDSPLAIFRPIGRRDGGNGGFTSAVSLRK
jgi:hypothetical protein